MTEMDMLTAVSNLATAVGVGVAAYQLLISRKQTRTLFEDGLNAQYREIIAALPVAVMLGEKLSDAERVSNLGRFYRYFDLCNEQAFLFARGRVSQKTWENWREGIHGNLARPAFEDAWQKISARSEGEFNYLRALLR